MIILKEILHKLKVVSGNSEVPSCKDLNDSCLSRLYSKCAEKEVQKKCPKLCGLCSVDSCKDLKDYCKYAPSCDEDEVKKDCPKNCGICVE